MMRLLLLLLVLGLALASPRAEIGPETHGTWDLRLLALERSPEGERAWFVDPNTSERLVLAVGDRFGDATLFDMDWETGEIRFRYPLDRPGRSGEPWVDRRRRTFSTFDGPPFASAGCPRFLERVTADGAWLRTGEPGELRIARKGDELCGGWRLAELDDSEAGRITLKRGARRLRVAAVQP